MEDGTVSTNVFLRRLHNFCLGMNWLPSPILAKRLWPKVKYKPKRAITWVEHRKILARETNPDRRDFYKLCWESGGSQTDVPSGDRKMWTGRIEPSATIGQNWLRSTATPSNHR